MKKLLSLLLCATMVTAACFAFSSCDKNENTNAAGADTEKGDVIDGGWAEADSPDITDDLRALFEKACETLTGVEYTPVSLLATQVVGGMNYRILCESRATVPGAKTENVIVTLYVDPEGNAEITDVSEYEGDGEMQIANPIVEYGMDADSLKTAEDVVGFEIAFPESINAENYIVISGKVLEIDFDGGYIRKAAGSEDISGDYNVYENVKTIDADGRKVTLKGNGDKIMLATWVDGDYTYCIGITDGVTEAEITSYVNAIK